ncbi:regulator of chromosome condensation domain-containing protein [Cyclospora cayetanensis]|uniref:Regulator of chromosome condensation domain-containing protein n=1 Tax=Cyclospora cayetanensis TaxID=88456 RepID=A0A1D3CYG5_9EIME|nr:regulator of chromosome condensation domain-containing protein [Cyclospora cayetanensis]
MIDPERSMGCPPMLPYAPHDGLLPSHVQPPKAGDLPLAVCDPSGNRGPLPEGDANDASEEDASEEGSWVCFWSADASPKNRRGFVGPQRFRSYLGITKLACGSSLAAFIASKAELARFVHTAAAPPVVAVSCVPKERDGSSARNARKAAADTVAGAGWRPLAQDSAPTGVCLHAADDGRLYCWDWGESGNMHACSPQLLEGRHLEEMHVVDVACGGGHIVCITGSPGAVEGASLLRGGGLKQAAPTVLCVDSSSGHAPRGHYAAVCTAERRVFTGPDEVLFPRPARQVACGEQFSLVLTGA